jgi:hypothetical protein
MTDDARIIQVGDVVKTDRVAALLHDHQDVGGLRRLGSTHGRRAQPAR